MSYSIIGKKREGVEVVFLSDLSYEQANQNLTMIKQMIQAGINTQYTEEDFRIENDG